MCYTAITHRDRRRGELLSSGIANELQAELERRQALPDRRPRNRRAGRYSLRSFAEDLGLSHGFLSRILRGERHLSQEQAHSIGLKLGLSEDERLRFVDLARVCLLKNKRLQKQVIQANPALQASTDDGQKAYALLDPNDFYILKRWYYPALLELTKIAPGRHTAKALAKRLGLSLVECEVALERLVTHRFLGKGAKNGVAVYSAIVGPLETRDIPSAKIRDFHQQMLSKAKESLERDDSDLRHISGITFAADAARLSQTKDLIREFRQRLAEIMCAGDTVVIDAVFQLNIQLFRLDRDECVKKGDACPAD